MSNNFKEYLKTLHINLFDAFNGVNHDNLEKLIEHLIKTQNNVYFTGVGKNGLLAENISATFASIGIKSFFIDPIHAIHGDLGKIKHNDTIIAISKSGTTQELISFIEKIDHLNCYKVLFTFGDNSNLFDTTIKLQKIPELDYHNVIPTSSMIAFNILLYIIVAYIVERTNFTLDNFLLNHPGGYIGKYGNK